MEDDIVNIPLSETKFVRKSSKDPKENRNSRQSELSELHLETEVLVNINRVVRQREIINRNIEFLENSSNGLKDAELSVLKVEAKRLDGLIADSMLELTEELEAQGVYSSLKSPDIRAINLQLTEEVVNILTTTEMSFSQAILLLNRICTAGWRFRDWGSKETIRDAKGYRAGEVVIGDDVDAPYHEALPRLMNTFSAKLDNIVNNPQNRNPEAARKAATWAYFIFLTIHPFADGNGRTARALVQLILNRLGQGNLTLPGIEANAFGGSKEASNALWQARIANGFSVMDKNWNITGTPDDITQMIFRNIGFLDPNLSKPNSFIYYGLKDVSRALFNPSERSRRRKGNLLKTDEAIRTALSAIVKTLRSEEVN